MRWIAATAAVVVLAVVALLGAASWLFYTESGLRWAAARAHDALDGKVRIEGLRGAIARDIEADSIRYQDEKAAVAVASAALRLELFSFLGGRAGIRSLQAESIDIVLPATDANDRKQAPLAIPFGVRVEQAKIARITLQQGAQRFVLEGFELRDAGVLPTGAVSATTNFSLSHEAYPVTAAVKLGGTLERLQLAFDGRIADVPASAHAIVTPRGARVLSTIEAQAGPVDLARLRKGWPRTALTVNLAGKASATLALAGTLSARNAAPGRLDDERVPLTALDTRFATLDFRSVSLQDLKAALRPRGALAGSGTLSAERADFDLRVSELDLSAFASKLRATQLSGQVRLSSGALQTLQGTLAQDDMRISADIVRDGERVEVRRLRAEAYGGVASGSGRLRLGDPLAFEAKLVLEHFDPARFGAYPSGGINGAVEGKGSLGAQPSVDARWTIERSTLEGQALESRGAARFSSTHVSRLVAQARYGSARVTARGGLGRRGEELSWAIEVPRIEEFVGEVEGRLQASGTLAGGFSDPQAVLLATGTNLRSKGIALKAATVKATGSLGRHTAELSARAEGLGAHAEGLDMNAQLRGGWQKSAGWSGEVLALRNSGPYSLQLRAPAALRVAPERIELAGVDATLAAGRLRIKELVWSEKRLQSSGEFNGLPAHWLLLTAGLAERLRSTLLLDGAWNLASTPRLTGEAWLRRSAGDLVLTDRGELALGLDSASLKVIFADGRMNAAAEVAARYATGSLKADVAPEPGAPGIGITPRSAVSFEASIGGIDLRAVAQPFFDEGRIDGRVAATLRGKGTLAEPYVTGSVRGDAIGVEIPPLGIFLKDGQLRAALEGESLTVSEFSIRGGEGRLTANGTLPLRLAKGSARLAWRADKFGLLERPDLRLVVSGSGEARIVEKRFSLSGSLRADRGYVELEQERLPKLGDDVVIVGRERPPQRGKATRVPLALDLQLDLGENLEIRGYGVDGKLTGQLQIETDADGELRAYGRIRTVNATFLAYGHRLQVDPGIAIFDGPIDNPALQMTAWRRNQQVEVGVQVSGNARAPRVQLVSNPPVSESERLSWLVLGRAPTDASKADLGLLQAAAGALLARGDQAPLDRRIAKAFGLDEISLRGSGEVADRVVAVGKRLSDRLYISYEQGLGTVASQLVKLDFSLTQRLAVRAETGTSSGIGLFYRFSWD